MTLAPFQLVGNISLPKQARSGEWGCWRQPAWAAKPLGPTRMGQIAWASSHESVDQTEVGKPGRAGRVEQAGSSRPGRAGRLEELGWRSRDGVDRLELPGFCLGRQWKAAKNIPEVVQIGEPPTSVGLFCVAISAATSDSLAVDSFAL